MVQYSNPDQPPRVWVISGYRAGERHQVIALAEALGWPFEIRDIAHNRLAPLVGLLRRRSFHGIDQKSSAPIEPPWPDLVISAGMRNEPIVRAIRQRSSNQTRLVHIGRTWAHPANFDLVVTTPQYRVPAHPKVLQNLLTLHRVTPERLRQAAEQGSTELADLPSPYIAVVVGGSSGSMDFRPHEALALAQHCCALARRLGGSLLVTTSARTSPAAAQALSDTLDIPHRFYRWQADDPANPYFAWLGLADQIVVTSDSIAMLSEACATGKPVYLFRPNPDSIPSLRARLYELLMRYGPQRLSRDISLVHDRVIATGQAAWLDTDIVARPPSNSAIDIDKACNRVRLLMRQT